MAYTPHTPVKPQAIASAFVEGLGDELTILNTFKRFDAAEFLGKANDTLTLRVPGTLPARSWGFRNDRRRPLEVDQYTEQTVNMKVEAEWLYSAVEMTPEQQAFDFGGSWGDLFNQQIDAITRKAEYEAMGQILKAPYELIQTLDVQPSNIREQNEMGRSHIFNQLVALRAKLRRMKAPNQSFTLVAGANVVTELVTDNKLIKNQSTGDGALANATVGTIAGFTVVEGPFTMDPDEAYIYSPDAFLFWNSPVQKPMGANNYATAAKNGVSMAWFRDYQAEYVIDRSVFATWKAWNYTRDFLSLESETGRHFTSEDQFFIRGAKVLLDPDGSRAAEAREPGDGKGGTPGSEADSFLARVFNRQRPTDQVESGLFMPPHLREGAETQNATPVVDGAAPEDVTPSDDA